jgi:hypothetical protein
MDATATLSLVADVPDVRVAQLMRDLAHDLARTGIEVRPPEAPMVPGQRGDIITFGQLVLDLATSGAVTALIECLRAYLARDRTLAFKVTRPNGTQVEINVKNVDDAAMERALRAASSA